MQYSLIVAGSWTDDEPDEQLSTFAGRQHRPPVTKTGDTLCRLHQYNPTTSSPNLCE
jgi:hypothetical protein